jgi:phage tail-like protein
MSFGQRKDRLRNLHFLVEIDGVVQADFSEATIPNSKNGSAKINPRYIEKSTLLKKHRTLTFKHGLTDSIELWRKLVEQGITNKARKSVAIILTDDMGNTAIRWELGGA